MKAITKQKITCPDCDAVQDAEVKHREGDPHATYIHWCDKCNCCIMESEWNEYEEATNERV